MFLLLLSASKKSPTSEDVNIIKKEIINMKTIKDIRAFGPTLSITSPEKINAIGMVRLEQNTILDSILVLFSFGKNINKLESIIIFMTFFDIPIKKYANIYAYGFVEKRIMSDETTNKSDAKYIIFLFLIIPMRVLIVIELKTTPTPRLDTISPR